MKYIEYKHTQSPQCRLMKRDTTERLIMSVEVEQVTFLTLLFANP